MEGNVLKIAFLHILIMNEQEADQCYPQKMPSYLIIIVVFYVTFLCVFKEQRSSCLVA